MSGFDLGSSYADDDACFCGRSMELDHWRPIEDGQATAEKAKADLQKAPKDGRRKQGLPFAAPTFQVHALRIAGALLPK